MGVSIVGTMALVSQLGPEDDAGKERGFGMSSLESTPARRLGREQWFVLIAAFLGWMFDGLEMGLFPVVAPPALKDLLGIAGAGGTVLSEAASIDAKASVDLWMSYLTASFLLGAASGGLIFGWLGDRIGRVRTMALSIFAYSLLTGACYFATSPIQLCVLRFLAAMGMGGEWALGVALVVEYWPDKLRPLMAGIIGAAGNVGYLLIAILAMSFAVTPQSWRWMMLACTVPAVLALLVLLVIPESQRWRQSVQRGNARPIREIFTTRLLGPTLLATAFASVALIGTWGSVTAFVPKWAEELAGEGNPHAKGWAQFWISWGAILGCLLGPIIGGRIGRRWAYFGLCLASLVVCGVLFRGLGEDAAYNSLFLAMCGLAGLTTASFYGWLPLYLPELFPTRVRATGQGLAYNFGRIFAAAGALTYGQLVAFFGSIPRACATITLIYLVGMVLIWFAPETKGKPLPE
jgi:MFS transporter, SHS family, sialic acid transporter